MQNERYRTVLTINGTSVKVQKPYVHTAMSLLLPNGLLLAFAENEVFIYSIDEDEVYKEKATLLLEALPNHDFNFVISSFGIETIKLGRNNSEPIPTAEVHEVTLSITRDQVERFNKKHFW